MAILTLTQQPKNTDMIKYIKGADGSKKYFDILPYPTVYGIGLFESDWLINVFILWYFLKFTVFYGNTLAYTVLLSCLLHLWKPIPPHIGKT